MYDAASSIVAQKLAQIKGVGQVQCRRQRAAGRAHRAESDGAEQVRHRPRGCPRGPQRRRTPIRPRDIFPTGNRIWEVGANDQIFKAEQLCAADRRLSQRIGGPRVRYRRSRRFGRRYPQRRLLQRRPGGACVAIFRQPGANIIETVDKIRAMLPQLQAAIPQSIRLNVLMDQTTTIRASVHDVERSLLISVILVILVVFVFLRDPRTTHHSQRRRAGVADRNVRRDVPARLQPRQPVADGADDLDRLCRRRRDCGDREHLALSRTGHAALRRPRCAAPRRSASPSSA